MRIITLASQKGGVGKSTLAICSYYSFILNSEDIKPVLIDLDPQGSLTNLKAIKELDYNLITSSNAKDAIEQAKGYDIAIIDTPPRLTTELDKLYSISDVVLIPTKTGLFDVVSCIQTVRNIKQVAPEAKAFAVLNMTQATTKLTDEIRQELTGEGINVFKSEIGNRLAFHHCQYEDGNIYNQKNPKAKKEVTALAMEIYSKLI